MIAPLPFFEDRGAPVRVYGEIQGLTRLGHRVDVVCYHLGRDVPEPSNIHRIINIPWYKRLSAGPTYHKVYLDTLLLLKAFKIIKNDNFDILHAHLHEGALCAQILSDIFKIRKPTIFDAQGSLTGEMLAHRFIKDRSLTLRFWEVLERKIYDGSGLILTSSPELIEILEQKFNISKRKVRFIPDGVDTDLFNPNRFNKFEIRQKYGMTDELVIIYSGLFTKYQGTDFLIEEVIPYVVREKQNIKFILVGYPVSKYEKLARKRGVDKYIMFMGKQKLESLPQLLAMADIAVTAKFMEAGEANQKILNYMAMGLPTVAFDYVYNRWVLQDSGILTKPGDANVFVKAILKLLDDSKLRESMRLKAKYIVNKEHSWTLVARKIVQVYEELVEPKRERLEK